MISAKAAAQYHTEQKDLNLYLGIKKDVAAEPVIPFGGLKHRFHVTNLCTDQGS